MNFITRYFTRKSKRLKFRRIVSACLGSTCRYKGQYYWITWTDKDGAMSLVSKTNPGRQIKINGGKINDLILMIEPEKLERVQHIIEDPLSHPQIELFFQEN